MINPHHQSPLPCALTPNIKITVLILLWDGSDTYLWFLLIPGNLLELVDYTGVA